MLKVSNGQSWGDAVRSTIPERKREGHVGTHKKARQDKKDNEEQKEGDNDENEEGEDEDEPEVDEEEKIPVENNGQSTEQVATESENKSEVEKTS